MHTWQMRDAMLRLAELVKCAQSQPQEISVNGKSVAVVLSREAYDRLAQKDETLVEFMRRSPLYGDDELSLGR